MREERRREQTKLLNKLRGIEEEPEEKEKIIEEEQEEDNKKSHKTLLLSIFIIMLIVLYATTIERKYLFKVNEYSIKTNKIDQNMNGLKIVNFSDIHYGTTIGEKELSKYVNKINELKPDIVFFTGDLLDKNINLSEDSINIIKKELSKIEASLYKYAIYGDNDYINANTYKEILTQSNFTLLDNEVKLLFKEGNIPIVISGINKYNQKDYSFINTSIEDIDITNYYKIILDHEPDNITNYMNYNPDLILNAHSLGGLIRIPYLGGILNKKEAKKYNKEYQLLNNTQIYNSFGLGTENIRIRLFNYPSISFFRLYLD